MQIVDCITSIIHQHLWGPNLKKNYIRGVLEQKRFSITDLENRLACDGDVRHTRRSAVLYPQEDSWY
jgi:hypothetical protein